MVDLTYTKWRGYLPLCTHHSSNWFLFKEIKCVLWNIELRWKVVVKKMFINLSLTIIIIVILYHGIGRLLLTISKNLSMFQI